MADPVPLVLCCVCGRQWSASNPRVLYRSADRRWWCRDEEPCHDRASRRDHMRNDGKTSIEVYASDRDRVNDLARELTAAGPGRFGQAETIRWLLGIPERIIKLEDAAQQERAGNGGQ